MKKAILKWEATDDNERVVGIWVYVPTIRIIYKGGHEAPVSEYHEAVQILNAHYNEPLPAVVP